MIIETKKNDVVIQGEVTHSSKMHVNLQGEAHLIRLLTKAYSDKIGSTIRETVANAKDSHIMANQELPVIVRIRKESNGEYCFEVEDRGLGLDDAEFNKYIMGIGESTKQSIANVLGGFGIGAKSASSYHEDGSYFYTCKKNGVERKFMIYAGEQVANSLLLHEKETQEINGVIVTIPIKNGDLNDFYHKIKEQLCYFAGVYFENCDVEDDFKVYRNDLFQSSDICQDRNMHISLDDVYYPIDFNKLGITPIQFPVAIRFNLEEGLITPIPNRENIEYTKQTKQAILDRIKLIADWFITKYNETLEETDDVNTIWSYFYNTSKYYEFGGHQFKLNQITKYSDIKLNAPTFKGISKMSLYDGIYNNYNSFLQCYKLVSQISYGKFSGKTNGEKVTDLVQNRRKVFLIKDKPSKKIIDYIKDVYGDCYFVTKHTDYELGRLTNTWGNRDNSFMKILKLQNYPKVDWRQVIQEYLSIVKIYEDKLIPINTVVIPKEWEEKKKKARKISSGERKQKLEGEVNFKFADNLEKYSQDWNCKFVSEVVNLKNFHKRKKIVIYGLEGQRRKLDDLFSLYKGADKRTVITAIVGQRDYEKLKNIKLHNLMSIEEFESSYNKPIARFVTSWKVKDFINKNQEIFRNSEFIKGNISVGFADCLNTLKTYEEANRLDENKLLNVFIEFCDKNKYYDEPIHQMLQDVKKEAEKVSFLKFFETGERYYNKQINKEAIPIIQELLRARKFRMDWKHYLKPEVIVEAEELAED